MNPVGLHPRGEVDLNKIIGAISKHPQSRRAGAIASFVGIVREDPVVKGSGNVSHLEYEAYEAVALKKLEEIRKAMLARPNIIEVFIHHIIDKVSVGEASLYVAVLGGHRQDVFSTLSEAVELVKREAPIWKKEFTSDRAYWVSTEPTGS